MEGAPVAEPEPPAGAGEEATGLARGRERVADAQARGRERVERGKERAKETQEKARLTFRRLTGLDRSGPPPAQTRSDQPWNVWTIPNAIGLVRAVMIPAFLVLAMTSDGGTDALPAVLFAVCAWGDYADGIAARVTGQYSRFGALLDPILDRLLVLSGVVVVWRFDLLPRWALALLAAREVYILVCGRMAMNRGIELRVNWPGRLAVGPLMTALMAGLCGLPDLGEVCLLVGLVLSYYAAFLYTRDVRREVVAAREPAPSSGA